MTRLPDRLLMNVWLLIVDGVSVWQCKIKRKNLSFLHSYGMIFSLILPTFLISNSSPSPYFKFHSFPFPYDKFHASPPTPLMSNSNSSHPPYSNLNLTKRNIQQTLTLKASSTVMLLSNLFVVVPTWPSTIQQGQVVDSNLSLKSLEFDPTLGWKRVQVIRNNFKFVDILSSPSDGTINRVPCAKKPTHAKDPVTVKNR